MRRLLADSLFLVFVVAKISGCGEVSKSLDAAQRDGPRIDARSMDLSFDKQSADLAVDRRSADLAGDKSKVDAVVKDLPGLDLSVHDQLTPTDALADKGLDSLVVDLLSSGKDLLLADSLVTTDVFVSGCGNGIIEPPLEVCDGNNTGTHTCKTQNFYAGTIGCSMDCKKLDTSGCTDCGNGIINKGEQCDVTQFGGSTCSSLGYDGGKLACKPDCILDTSNCYKCGDTKKNGNEKCDGADLGGNTCQTEGYDGGALACGKTCSFDPSGCYKCGDKKKNGSEKCDGADYGGKTCQTEGYDGGTLACNKTCSFDLAGCYKCGDKKKNGSEQCDDADLGTSTCESLGYFGGKLACANTCKFTTSSCNPVPGKWVTIKAGYFGMGSPGNEPCRQIDEIQHGVTLSRKFEMQTTEVTQGQYKKIMGTNPSAFQNCGLDCPVENVTWHEAAAFANAVSNRAKLANCYKCGSGTCQAVSAYLGSKIYDCPGYRLPTEAEWEYAYRAGTSTYYYNGNVSKTCPYWNCGHITSVKAIAWIFCNSNATYKGCYKWSGICRGTHPVGKLTANSWGLYDMAGNVFEWCHDMYGSYSGLSSTNPVGTSGKSHVYRGGGWLLEPGYARAASRSQVNVASPGGQVGFRLARTLP